MKVLTCLSFPASPLSRLLQQSVVVAQSPALAANLTAHSEWLRINMPCIPATALSGWALFSASIFGCCATAAVEAAV